MANAILSFLLSIVISLGGSVTADNIGQDFATIYSNQDPSVQKKMDQYLFDPGGQLIRDITLEGTKLTTEMLYDIQGGKVSSKVINDSIGHESWKDFINSHQNNVQTVGSFSSGDYSFKYGVYYSFDKQKYRSTTYPYVDIYYKGELMRNWIGTSYTTNQMNQIKHDEIRSYYNEMCKTIYYDDENKAVIVATVSIPPQQFLLGSYIKDDVITLADSIGSIADISIAGTNVGQLPIAVDGSVTLPDGTKVYPNSDGTYNIDNRVYNPIYNISNYDDSALLGLLQQILQKIDSLEGQLEYEKEKETDKELEEKQEEALEDLEEAAAESEDVLSQYTYSSKRWANIFPFCIPWDFVRGVKLLSASPVAPKFTIPFEIPEFGSFKGYKTEIVLNFSDYEKYFKPVRWFTTTFFLISLGFITFKIVKGAA